MSPFEKKLDILMYIVHASKPVSRNDISIDATDLTLSSIVDALGTLIGCGLISTEIIDRKRFYSATEKAKQIFGVKK